MKKKTLKQKQISRAIKLAFKYYGNVFKWLAKE